MEMLWDKQFGEKWFGKNDLGKKYSFEVNPSSLIILG